MNLYFYVIEVHVFTTIEMDTLCYFTHCAICVIIYDYTLHLVSVYLELCCVSGSPVHFDRKHEEPASQNFMCSSAADPTGTEK